MALVTISVSTYCPVGVLHPDGDLGAEVHPGDRLHAGRALVGPEAVRLEGILERHARLRARDGRRQRGQQQRAAGQQEQRGARRRNEGTTICRYSGLDRPAGASGSPAIAHLQSLGWGCHLGGVRIGIDVGGTKIEGLLLGGDGREITRERIATPAAYGEVLAAIGEVVERLSQAAGVNATVGVGTPRFPAAGPRAHPELEPTEPQRPAARQGSGGRPAAPGSAGQRRQVLRPLGGDRRRGRGPVRPRPVAPRRRLRRDAGDGRRRRHRRRRPRPHRRERRRHGMEPHHPALSAAGRRVAVRLLLRAPGLYRVVHLGPWSGGDLPASGRSGPRRGRGRPPGGRRDPLAERAFGATRIGWRARWRW